jgi:hypothetical protein
MTRIASACHRRDRGFPAVLRCALVLVACSTASAALAGPPTRRGQCKPTTIKEIGHRLYEGYGGPAIEDSGSMVNMADGGHQVSYDTLPAVHASRVGDPVLVCVAEVETGCPRGSTGYVYRTTNRRTGQSWTMGGSTKACAY